MNEMNKIITSEGNVQFQTADGNIINVHPFHIYTTFNEDTVSFILIAMPKYSGLAIFTSKASDLEVDGTVYTIEQLPNALSEAFAKAGAVARYEIVDELPTSGQSNTIYLLPKSEGIGYDEYIYVNGEWELIGDTDIEFNKYLTKEAFSAYSAATELKIDGKVVELTQAEYDAMVSGGTIDPLVLYVITDAVEVNMADYYKKVETSGATELSTAFANEASARTDADTALQGLIDVVSGNVETESARAISAETALSDKIDVVSGSVDTEITARETADSVISGAVDSVSGAVISEAERAVSAETELQTAIDNEVSARTEADSALQSAIDTVSGDVETLSGSVESLGDNKANKSEAVASAAYVSSSTTIDLKDISGNVISQVDASDFIIDGMVDDVKIENGYLVIKFNTDSGKQDIQIPLTDIFNPSNYYDKTATDNAISAATSGKLDTSIFETYSGNVNTALNGKANSSDVVTSVIASYDEYAINPSFYVSYTKNGNDYPSEIFRIGNGLVVTDEGIGEHIYRLSVSGGGITSGEVETMISAATSGLQETLVAGSGITISGNVISAEAQPITVDPSLDSGSTNAVANSAITIAIDELSASSVTNCDNVVIEDAIPTPPSTIVDENVKVSWEDDYTETYAVDYEGLIGDGVEHVGYNVSKLEFGSFTTELGTNFRFSADDCYSDLKTVIFNGNVNLGEVNTPFASAFNLEAVYFYAPNPSAITCDNFDDGFLNYVYNGCETYETSAATYPIYVADLAAYSGATLYNDGNNDVTWGQHFGNRLQEIPKGKKLVLTDIDSRLAEDEEVTAAALNNINDRLSEDEEVTAAGLNAVNDKFDGLQLKKLTQQQYDALTVKDPNTLYVIV